MTALVERAGVDVSPRSAWLLLRINRTGGVEPARLAHVFQMPVERIDEELTRLRTDGLIVEQPAASPLERHFALTQSGCVIVDQLLTARRDRLEELWSDWPEDRRAEIAAVLQRLAQDLVPERRSA
jgi:DNA-binding MarR family transcriptional regulator